MICGPWISRKGDPNLSYCSGNLDTNQAFGVVGSSASKIRSANLKFARSCSILRVRVGLIALVVQLLQIAGSSNTIQTPPISCGLFGGVRVVVGNECRSFRIALKLKDKSDYP